MKKLLLIVPLIFLAVLAFGQKKITGKVVEQKGGAPLPGVSVMVVETSKSTSTDPNGAFTIVAETGQSLKFSFIGLKPQTIKVTSETSNLVVQMEEESSVLEQVVVTGYQAQRKVDVIGAVAVVDMKPLKNITSGNPMQALQGRIPSLYIEKNGTPNGENSRVVLRGVNTLGNSDPLYVIDGVPTKRANVLQTLNPSSIESIQVLKDASAASIYGSRASNGVIIVTTKNGSANDGRLNIELNSGYTFQTMKPQKLEMMTSEQRGRALWQASVNDRTDPVQFSSIYAYDWNGDYGNPVLNAVTIQPFVGGDPTVPAANTDWQDAVYDNAGVLTTDLTLSGGTKNSSLLINLGYLNNSGIMKFTDYERYSAKLNGATQFFDGKLKVGMNTAFFTSNETLPTTDLGGAPTPELAITLAPTIPVYTTDGRFAGPLGAGYSDRNNPVDMQYLNRWDNRNRSSLFGNVSADLILLTGLTFRSNFGLDYSNNLFKDAQLAFQEGFLGRNVNSLARNTENSTSLTWSNTLNYQREFGKHRLGLLAGIEAVRQDIESFGAFREGFAAQTVDYFYLDAGSGRSTNFGRATGSRLLSQFGKINYTFADKYLVALTLRRDGSSRFGEENTYGIFPAANLGWRMNNEPFMKDITAISNLKLRVGIGRVGNQDIGDLARFGLFEARYGTLFNNGVGFPGQWLNNGTAYDLAGINTGSLPSGFVSVQAANPRLKWESTEEINAGLDYGFMDEKISGSFDYFVRKTKDILIQPPLASAVGEGKIKWINGATKKNKGFEFTLNYNHRGAESGFNYTISANLARFRDEITELPEEVRTAYPGNAQKSIVGQSQFAIFGYKTDGLFQNQAEVDAHANQVGAGPGRIKYVDLDGNGEINADDRDWLGTTLPSYEYGLRIDLSYKNFDFSAFGSGVSGRSGFEPYIYFNNFARVRENMGPGALNAWTSRNTGSSIPMLTLVDANQETRVSDYFYINTSYFKMRNIQLGYTLPQSMLKRLRLNSLRLYLMGENLFWFKSKEYQGADPEVSNFGVLPIPTSLSFGINVTVR